jgi:hypothetical protein
VGHCHGERRNSQWPDSTGYDFRLYEGQEATRKHGSQQATQRKEQAKAAITSQDFDSGALSIQNQICQRHDNSGTVLLLATEVPGLASGSVDDFHEERRFVLRAFACPQGFFAVLNAFLRPSAKKVSEFCPFTARGETIWTLRGSRHPALSLTTRREVRVLAPSARRFVVFHPASS